MYITRGGAFFIVHDEIEVPETSIVPRKYWFEATSREVIEKLVESGPGRGSQIEIIDEAVLISPPEAAIERVTSATIFLRLPASLKSRIETAAAECNMSVNAWALRCFEICVTLKTRGA